MSCRPPAAAVAIASPDRHMGGRSCPRYMAVRREAAHAPKSLSAELLSHRAGTPGTIGSSLPSTPSGVARPAERLPPLRSQRQVEKHRSADSVQLAVSLDSAASSSSYMTSILLGGEEFTFNDAGIISAPWPRSHALAGRVPRVVDLGRTTRSPCGPQLLAALDPYFAAGTYHAVHKNTNSFVDCALFFLLGTRLHIAYRDVCIASVRDMRDARVKPCQELDAEGIIGLLEPGQAVVDDTTSDSEAEHAAPLKMRELLELASTSLARRSPFHTFEDQLGGRNHGAVTPPPQFRRPIVVWDAAADSEEEEVWDVTALPSTPLKKRAPPLQWPQLTPSSGTPCGTPRDSPSEQTTNVRSSQATPGVYTLDSEPTERPFETPLELLGSDGMDGESHLAISSQQGRRSLDFDGHEGDTDESDNNEDPRSDNDRQHHDDNNEDNAGRAARSDFEIDPLRALLGIDIDTLSEEEVAILMTAYEGTWLNPEGMRFSNAASSNGDPRPAPNSGAGTQRSQGTSSSSAARPQTSPPSSGFMHEVERAWQRVRDTWEQMRSTCCCYVPPPVEVTPPPAATSLRRRLHAGQALGQAMAPVSFESYTTVFTWSGPEDSSTKGQCAVCLDVFIDGEEIRALSCDHRFHKECIDKWLRKSHKCPTCKQSILS